MEVALRYLLESIDPLAPRNERMTVETSLGRTLSEDVPALRNIPHYRASAVDGYALRAAVTAGASPARPAHLSLEACQWVNTGGLVESSFDAVVMVEDTSFEGSELLVSKPITVGTNVRPPGDDVMRGQIIVREGDVVTPQYQALLRAAGIEGLSLRSLPRTLYLPTGDEILPVSYDGPLPAGTVPETNSILLKGLFARWGFPITVGDIIPDDPARLRQALEQNMDAYDLFLVGAGSAKGKKDHTAEVFSSLGDILFRWVRTRPGRPAMAARMRGKPLLCLPGFPMSSVVVAMGLVFPLLFHLQGLPVEGEKSLTQALGSFGSEEGELLFAHSSSPGVEEWLRCQMAQIRGKTIVWPLSGGASSMRAMSEADGIAIISEEKLECPKGMRVLLHKAKEISLERRILFQGSNDPAVERLVSPIRRLGCDMVIRSVGSVGGLSALSRGECHLAACHLIDPETQRYNDSYIARFRGDAQWRRRQLFFRQQGLLVAKGNPKGISSIEDLVRADLSIVNRQPGAGTRVLLDYLLKEKNITPSSVQGYDRQCITHLDAASRIASGLADVALGIKMAAEAMDLDFLPIAEEPYEIVYPEDCHDHPGVVAFLESLEDRQWRMEIKKLGGYRWIC